MSAESPELAAVGLCSRCTHATRQQSARGSEFWRCRLADRDERFRRYPQLPVRECSGHEAGPPETRGT